MFSEITSFENITFKIKDESILKIKDGVIIPLNVGKTDIEFLYNDTTYILHVNVINNNVANNPNTSTGIKIEFVLMSIVLCFTFIFRRKRLV